MRKQLNGRVESRISALRQIVAKTTLFATIWRSALIRLSTRPFNCFRISERRVHCVLAQQPSPHDVDASIRAERHESKKALGVVPWGFLASQSNFRNAGQC